MKEEEPALLNLSVWWYNVDTKNVRQLLIFSAIAFQAFTCNSSQCRPDVGTAAAQVKKCENTKGYKTNAYNT